MKTRRALKKKTNIALISHIEPKKIEEAIKNSIWVHTMQEKLDQSDKNQVWKLLRRPADAILIGTKWGFRNKLIEDVKMDVKSVFFNGFIDEEVYAKQPPGFEDSKFPYHMYKLTKVLYGNKLNDPGNIVIQVYVDDIIFGNANPLLCKEFANLMQSEFEMSMMGELAFFLGLQIQQSEVGTFQSAPKESHLTAVKRIIRYLIGTISYRLWYPHSNNFKLEGFSYADLA
uniref:Reverse transcriptase Ty1/copia-type domain-containing protein n=1 Tax=Nicotiana tabacum TaxID=4097 RepID=A0A1S3YDR3_TOBAC|nr:PREDICTED: uncharacterized protein LOC107774991 [Nicotiana tabacum]